jgi:hypothetical protein
MKKLMVILAIVAVTAVAFTSVSPVFASSGNGNRFGGNGAGTGMAGQTGTPVSIDGALHDYYIAAYAEALNLSVAEIESRLASGETLSSIALSTGITLDEFRTLVVDARSSALAAAVADGVITQDQADWLTSHMGGANSRAMVGNANAFGSRGRFGTIGTCPYLQAAQ